MRKVIIATAVVAGGAAGMLAFAVPAFAATTATTPVTVTVNGGALAITAPAGPVSLGSVAGSVAAQPLPAVALGNVQVSDLRAGILGWTVTAGSTDFTGAGAIPAAAMTYTTPAATVTGTAIVTPASLIAMTNTGNTVQTATIVTGDNTATWSPTIGVTVPAGAVAGTYSATITHSVA